MCPVITLLYVSSNFLFIFEEERLDFLYGNRPEHLLSLGVC